MDNYKKQVEELNKEINSILSETDLSLNKKLESLNAELYSALENEKEIEKTLTYCKSLLSRYKEQIRKNLKQL